MRGWRRVREEVSSRGNLRRRKGEGGITNISIYSQALLYMNTVNLRRAWCVFTHEHDVYSCMVKGTEFENKKTMFCTLFNQQHAQSTAHSNNNTFNTWQMVTHPPPPFELFGYLRSFFAVLKKILGSPHLQNVIVLEWGSLRMGLTYKRFLHHIPCVQHFSLALI